jgi:hypothetical protein
MLGLMRQQRLERSVHQRECHHERRAESPPGSSAREADGGRTLSLAVQ